MSWPLDVEALASTAPDPTFGHPLGYLDWRFVVEFLGMPDRDAAAVLAADASFIDYGDQFYSDTPPVPITGLVWQNAVPGWIDVTSRFIGGTVLEGADEFGGRIKAATATVELRSIRHDLDPWTTHLGSFAGNGRLFGPGLVMRLGFVRPSTSEWAPLYTGVVEQWDHVGSSGSVDDRAVIELIDPFASIARTELLDFAPTADVGTPTVIDDVNDVAALAGHRFGVNLYNSDVEAIIVQAEPSTYTGNAADYLVLSTQARYLDIRADRRGRIETRYTQPDNPVELINPAAFVDDAPAFASLTLDTIDVEHVGLVTSAADDALANHVVIDNMVLDAGTPPSDPTPYQEEDAASIRRYGRRTLAVDRYRTNNLVEYDADATLARRQRLTAQLSEVTLTDRRHDLLMAVEPRSPFAINVNLPQAATPLAASGYVRSIEHRLNVFNEHRIHWTGTYTLDTHAITEPAPVFIADDTTYLLDGDDIIMEPVT